MELANSKSPIVAEIRDGQIIPLQPVTLPEGAKVLVTPLPSDEEHFWQEASHSSLAAVWANEQDDVYAQLFEK
ncbi:MAG TPA: antitoxin family protein [Pirellulales bacterium]|jgi:predicted DNA-binding antitoxin AbrB/MazE fold protein|nr:antitoxin family protein [Pirellulales bacterium]